MTSWRSRLLYCIAAVPLWLALTVAARFGRPENDTTVEQKIAGIVQIFAAKLGIAEHVTVSIVSGNFRLASVERASLDSFQMSFEEEFVRGLDDKALQAAVAHELGHVWIFTHFPYLQTEVLANEQAMKLVPRADLENIYRKVWAAKGEKGDFSKVLGQ